MKTRRFFANIIRRCFWTTVAYYRLRRHGAQIGPGLSVTGPLVLHIEAGSKIIIGRDCRINSGYQNNPVGGCLKTVIWIMKGAELILGDRCGISNTTLVASVSITIERDAMIGGGCSLYDTDFHSVDSGERLKRPDPGIRRVPIRVGECAFIGGHCIVLPGVSVGANSVIGAGSVVPRPVPTNEVWAGNPATKRRDLRKNSVYQ